MPKAVIYKGHDSHVNFQLAGAWRCQGGEEEARDDLSPPCQPWEEVEVPALPLLIYSGAGGLVLGVSLGSHWRILFKKMNL